MIRALLDTNIILDLFLDRQPFVKEAAALWMANEQGHFEGYIAAITPINLWYIARKTKDAATIQRAIIDLLTYMHPCPLDLSVLQTALTLSFKDYEDAVQEASAAALNLDAIITRNLKDFSASAIPVFSPADFLKRLP